jgi:ElaB/YqjD/DUF883 family membrane-anchored ribosome-binding protein
MATHENLQHLPHAGSSSDRSGAADLGGQSRRVVEDVKELCSIALTDAGHAARGLRGHSALALYAGRRKAAVARYWLEVMVRGSPLQSVLVALAFGALLGYVLHRL